MISHKKNFIFIHVPKTGGNSLQNVLRKYSEDRIVCRNKNQDGVERFGVVNPIYNTVKHSRLSHYRRAMPPRLFDGMMKFATVRNPWDMLVSGYLSPNQGSTKWDPEVFEAMIERTPTLRDFIVADPSSRKPIDADVDFIMRFEHLEDDFREICRRLDIPFEKLPHRNKSNRSHYSHYYNDALREKVSKRFAEEIEIFGYTFEASPNDPRHRECPPPFAPGVNSTTCFSGRR